MEERDSPARDGEDEPPMNSSSYVPLPLPNGSSEGFETYVVHFPRDQVYRVPPPENARIVESYQSPHQNQKNCGCPSCCCLIFVPLIIVALVTGTFLATIFVLYNPKSPEFAVTHIHAKNLPLTKSNHSLGVHQKPKYIISLQLKNRNKRMDVHYENGEMSLNFKGKEIASGKFSSIKQEAAKEIEVVETLSGPKTALPISIKKSLNDKKPKSMILTIEVQIKVTSWVKDSEKNLIVTCDLKVKTFSKGTKVLSQNCRTDS